MYADAFGLFVFGAFLTSVRVSINPQTGKTKFCVAWGMLFLYAVVGNGAADPV